MDSESPPLVSVVTPVYNGEQYLAECIESILAQTYQHWEYVIVNNCSTDGSLEIAQSYAERDERIRVYDNSEFLSSITNWNQALSHISTESRYCKVVHADDWIFPECLAQMVALAEANPTVGIVGAYRLNEEKVDLDGLPYPSSVVRGREAGRLSLKRKPLFLFGSPTSLLFRADLMRQEEAFYDKSLIHADTDVCFRILQKHDFGFVHQVLTYTRRHNESVTSFISQFSTHYFQRSLQVKKYGPFFLSETEYAQRMEDIAQSYHAMLARSLFGLKGSEFWAYHQKNLAELGIEYRRRRMIRPLLKIGIDGLFNFKQTGRQLFRLLLTGGKKKAEPRAEKLSTIADQGA